MKISRLASLFLVLTLAIATLAQGQAVPPQDPQRPDNPAPKANASPRTVPADPQRPDANVPDETAQHNPNAPREIQLSLTPAAEPLPALKYELLPGPMQRKPGNAATNYYRALLHAQQVRSSVAKAEQDKHNQEYEQWFSGPLNDSTKLDMRKWVGYYQAALAETKSAAYCEECKWNLRIQDLRGLDTITFLLHDFQGMRDLGRVLKFRARLEVSDGKLDEAIESTRQGFQLARDTAEPELLINSLIGIAIANMMGEELIEIIDQPGSPNLYWAIASLPKPLIDLRRGLRFEMEMPERMFPFLNDAESAERSPEEWQRLLVDSISKISELSGNASQVPEWQLRLTATAGLMLVYPEAKKRLLAEGFDKQQLDKMPTAQVVAIQASRAQKRVYHDVFKWSALPYSQQRRRVDETMQQLLNELGRPGKITAEDPLFLARLLLPGVQQAMLAEIRLQTHLSATQTIEALRMHAAANQGQLPRTLEEVTIVPVPLNPATDQPFEYQVADGVATLLVRPPPGQPIGSWNARNYVIRIETK